VTFDSARFELQGNRVSDVRMQSLTDFFSKASAMWFLGTILGDSSRLGGIDLEDLATWYVAGKTHVVIATLRSHRPRMKVCGIQGLVVAVISEA
jgi:hypothetical protein